MLQVYVCCHSQQTLLLMSSEDMEDIREPKELRIKDAAFWSGGKVVLRSAKTDLYWAIKKTKLAYTRKIESKFCDSRDTGPM